MKLPPTPEEGQRWVIRPDCDGTGYKICLQGKVLGFWKTREWALSSGEQLSVTAAASRCIRDWNAHHCKKTVLGIYNDKGERVSD